MNKAQQKGRNKDESSSEQWSLVRDAAVLQVKLVVDGLRDLVLVPTSIVAAILSLLSSKQGHPGPQFDQLMALGKRSERWIDLFGTHGSTRAAGPESEEANLDAFVNRMESYVVDEYKRGGLTRQAKERVDKALNALHKKESTNKPE
jgi:hypothetical protein